MRRRLGSIFLVCTLLIGWSAGWAAAQDGVVSTAREGIRPELPAPPARRVRRPLGPVPVDPFQWLRDERSPETRAWITTQDARTEALLKTDARFAETLAGLRASLVRESAPQIVGDQVNVLRQSAAHPRGVWRRTAMEAFSRGKPRWEDLLDLDALAETEHRAWRWDGADCSPGRASSCLVRLSDGQGATTREFDLATRAFRTDGFVLGPEVAAAAWIDRDTLLVAPEPPASQAPTLVRLKRRQALGAAALAFHPDAGRPGDRLLPVVFRDAGASPLEGAVIERAGRAVELHVQVQGAYRRFPLPEDFSVVGVVGGKLVFRLNQGWDAPDLDVRLGPGQLLSFDLDQIVQRRKELTPQPVLNIEGRPYILQVARTRSAVLLRVRENDGVRLYVCSPARRGWTVRLVPPPQSGVITSVVAAEDSDEALAEVERFPEPPTVWSVNTATAVAAVLPSAAVTGSTGPLVVEAARVAARDGAEVEYVVARTRAAPSPGARPTLLLARSDLSLTLGPDETDLASAWLAGGGAVALPLRRSRYFDVRNATLRVLLAYNDLASVAQDLDKRKQAGAGKMALVGEGEAGVVAGIAAERFRSLWSAVVLFDPLLDIQRAATPTEGRQLAQAYGDPRDGAVRRFWDETSPYNDLHPGVGYPPMLIVQAPGDERRSDGRRFTARLTAQGGYGLFFDPPSRPEIGAWPYAERVAAGAEFARNAH